MNVLIFMPDQGGCGWYRQLQPAAWLARMPNVNVKYFKTEHWKHITPEASALLREADVVLACRLTNLIGQDIIRDYNPEALVVLDFDDDLFHLPPENQAAKNFDAEALEAIRVNLFRADLVTVSTPPLAAALARYTRRDPLVLYNGIDPRLFEVKPLNDKPGPVRVGWAGSITHIKDVEPALEGLYKAVQELGYDRITPVFFGMLGNALAARFDPRKTICVPPIEMKRYYERLFACGLDIGLAPVRPHPFNASKSAVKWYEYSMVNAATIASRVGPYEAEIKDGSTGRLVSHYSEFAWRDAIVELVEERDLRHALAGKARAWIGANRSPETWAVRLYECLEKELALKAEKAAGRERRLARRPNPPAAPTITVAILSWVPEENDRLGDLIQCLPRILGRITRPETKVVILDQGSCAAATDFCRAEAEIARARGQNVVVEVLYENQGVCAINDVFKRHPADFFLKADNDIIPPIGFDALMLKAYLALEERGHNLGMLALDPRWGQADMTFGQRDGGKCISARGEVNGHKVFWMKERSTVVGMCRIKRASKYHAWGGHPEGLKYGTDQIVADRSAAAGFVNAHLLPMLAARPGAKPVPAPLIHIGSTTEERKLFKKEQLHKMTEMRAADAGARMDDAGFVAHK